MPNHLIDLHVPGLGDSISEARIANWVKAEGDAVTPDDVVAELETDKATVELPAGGTGLLRIVKAKGQTVAVGDVIARIEAGAAGTNVSARKPATTAAAGGKVTAPAGDQPLSPAVQRLVTENKIDPAKVAPTGPGHQAAGNGFTEFGHFNARFLRFVTGGDNRRSGRDKGTGGGGRGRRGGVGSGGSRAA